jgi:hypothetical protein
MTLGYYSNRGYYAPGFAAPSVPDVPSFRAQAQAAGQAELQKLYAASPVPTSVAGAKRVAGQEAQRVANEVFAKLDVPSIPLSIPRELSVDAVKDAAMASGAKYAESAIQAKTGIPVSLPTELSVDAFGKSLASLIPTDAKAALNTALAIGTQAAAGAVTSLLVGAGVGSVVPGLGTIVGIGAALGVQALKGVFEPPPGRKCETKWRCPEIPSKLSVLEMLPWLVEKEFAVLAAIRAEEGPSRLVRVSGGGVTRAGSAPCVRGETVECAWRLAQVRLTLWDKTHPQATIPELGLPQLKRLIPQYEHALRRATAIGGAFGAQKDSAGFPRHVALTGFKTQHTIATLLAAMKARVAYLGSLHQQAQQAMASGNKAALADLRWKVAEELKKATRQLAYAPGSETTNWFKIVIGAYRALGAAEQASQAKMHERLKVARERGEKRLREDPAAKAAHDAKIAAMQRSERQQKAPAKMTVAQATAHCTNLMRAWAADPKNRAQAACLKPSDHKALIDICVNSLAHGVVPHATALQMIQAHIRSACARKR